MTHLNYGTLGPQHILMPLEMSFSQHRKEQLEKQRKCSFHSAPDFLVTTVCNEAYTDYSYKAINENHVHVPLRETIPSKN